MPSINKVQILITEIERVDKTRKTMMKRMRKQGEVLNKAKKLLRETGIRPYHKRNSRQKSGIEAHN